MSEVPLWWRAQTGGLNIPARRAPNGTEQRWSCRVGYRGTLLIRNRRSGPAVVLQGRVQGYLAHKKETGRPSGRARAVSRSPALLPPWARLPTENKVTSLFIEKQVTSPSTRLRAHRDRHYRVTSLIRNSPPP